MQFVFELATGLHLPATIETLSVIEQSVKKISNNTSTRFRAARFAHFAKTIVAENLQGVLLAHHADDQAETVLMRILRGSAPENLAGMRVESYVRNVKVLRPLLNVCASELKNYLRKVGQSWREDASNKSSKYQRNRLRAWLSARPEMTAHLLHLGAASAGLRQSLDQSAPILDACFASSKLSDLAKPLARHAAARWLAQRGIPRGLIEASVCERLIQMACDAAFPWRQSFPGNVIIARRKGIICVESLKAN